VDADAGCVGVVVDVAAHVMAAINDQHFPPTIGQSACNHCTC
jgi:hypothetical protein